MQQNGLTLEFASDELKKDCEIVLTAVQDIRWDKFASDDLKKDCEIVLAAVQQSGYALQDIELVALQYKNDKKKKTFK